MPTRLAFLTVMPAPYQREFFAALAEHEALEVDVFYYTQEAHDREWSKTHLAPYEEVLPGRTMRALGPSAHWNPSVMVRLAQNKPDLTVISDYSSLTAQRAMRALSRRGEPWVFWGEIPGMRARGRAGSALREFLQRPIVRSAAGVAAIGSHAVESYRSLCGDDRPIANIPYHCETATFSEAAMARSREEVEAKERVVFLFSGQMIERKGVDLLVEAFNTIAVDDERLELELVGGGPGLEAYRALVKPELASRVRFLGFRQPEELPKLFAAADVFVMPSRHDGWGVVVNEALAAALPIIASAQVGAARDLVEEGKNGFVVSAGDKEILADRMREVSDSRRLREDFSQHSARLVERWNLDSGVRRWLDLCAELGIGPGTSAAG